MALDNDPKQNTYLNDFFFLVLSRFFHNNNMFHWQSMGSLAPVDAAGAVFMARSVWNPIGVTGSGPSMPESPTISKKMVAYLESFLGVAPFRKPVIDTRIDMLYNDAVRRLAKVPEKEYVNYLGASLRHGTLAFRPRQSTLPIRQTRLPRSMRPLTSQMAEPTLVLRAWCFQMLNKFAKICFLVPSARRTFLEPGSRPAVARLAVWYIAW